MPPAFADHVFRRRMRAAEVGEILAHEPRQGPYAAPRRNFLNVNPDMLPAVYNQMNLALPPPGPIEPQAQLQQIREWNQQREAEEGVRPNARRLQEENNRRARLYMERMRPVREYEDAEFQQGQAERRANRAAMDLHREVGEIEREVAELEARVMDPNRPRPRWA